MASGEQYQQRQQQQQQQQLWRTSCRRRPQSVARAFSAAAAAITTVDENRCYTSGNRDAGSRQADAKTGLGRDHQQLGAPGISWQAAYGATVPTVSPFAPEKLNTCIGERCAEQRAQAAAVAENQAMQETRFSSPILKTVLVC